MPFVLLAFALLPLPILWSPGLLKSGAIEFGWTLWQTLASIWAFRCALGTALWAGGALGRGSGPVTNQSLLRGGRNSHLFGLRALALAWGLNALGDALFFVWQSRLGSSAFQSAARVPYLGANLVLFVALLALLHADELHDRVRSALDSLLLTVCAALMMWRFVFAPALQHALPGAAPRPILVVYTVIVLGLLFLSLFSLASRRTAPQSLRPRAILCAAFLLICASNTLLLVGAARGDGRMQILGTMLWSAAMLVAGLSALQSRDVSPTPGTEPIFRLARLVPSVLPYGFLLIAIALAADALDELDAHERTNTGVAIVILAILALRQILVAIQNVRLQNQLVRFSLELDELVALRTRQLEAQNRFSMRLNAALYAKDSVAAIVEFAPILLPHHPFALWLQDGEKMRLSGTNADPEWAQWLQNHAPTEGDFATNRTPPTLRVAPLQRGGNVLGFLAIVIEPNGFDPTEDAILKFMAREGALALQNARLFEQALVDAERDDVTELLNHRGVQERLEKLVEAARTSGEPLGVALMDLDRFKLFNDTYTHAIGDLVLKHVAAILNAELGAGTLFGRFGGDEFLLVFPGARREEVLRQIEVLGDIFASRGFVVPGQRVQIPLSVSFGVALFPEDAGSLQRLLSVADSHLFAAKSAGVGVRSSTEMERTRARLRTHDSFGALDAIVAAIDAKDSYTRSHSEDVTELALQLAGALGLSEETRKMLRTGALLHDVGKIAVSDEVLCKPGQLSPEEFAQMKTHPWIGAILVAAMPGLGNIIEMVRSHHERFDGAGYPDRLAGEAIPLLGRLLAVADAYSAMTQNRPYRRALSPAEALQRIEEGAGTQFDPAMAAAFVRLKRAALNGTYGGEISSAPLPEGTQNKA